MKRILILLLSLIFTSLLPATVFFCQSKGMCHEMVQPALSQHCSHMDQMAEESLMSPCTMENTDGQKQPFVEMDSLALPCLTMADHAVMPLQKHHQGIYDSRANDKIPRFFPEETIQVLS